MDHHPLLALCGAVLVLWLLFHWSGVGRERVVCRRCGSVGQARIDSPRSLIIEILLWISGLVPGVIYSLWCRSQTHKVCARCDSRDIVPLETPVGQEIAKGFEARAQGQTPFNQTPGRPSPGPWK